jgi:hypothetical protein
MEKYRSEMPQETPPVFISAGNEFLDPTRSTQDPKKTTKEWCESLTKGYNELGYTYGVVTKAEKAWFDENCAVPEGFSAYSDMLSTSIIEHGKYKIGIVNFPELPPGMDMVPEIVSKELMEAEAKLRPKCNLVIGLSPWGVKVEQKWLGVTSQNYDIVYGTGPGSGIPSKHVNADKTLWLRPYPKGMLMNIVHMREWPSIGEKITWQRGKTALLGTIKLEPSIADHEKFQPLAEAAKKLLQ